MCSLFSPVPKHSQRLIQFISIDFSLVLLCGTLQAQTANRITRNRNTTEVRRMVFTPSASMPGLFNQLSADSPALPHHVPVRANDFTATAREADGGESGRHAGSVRVAMSEARRILRYYKIHNAGEPGKEATRYTERGYEEATGSDGGCDADDGLWTSSDDAGLCAGV